MKKALGVVIALALAGLLGLWLLPAATDDRDGAPIPVGVLHSLTGTMAISETSVVDVTLLAIAEINARGGVLGRPIRPVVADGRSDPAIFAREAARLIDNEHVVALFGC